MLSSKYVKDYRMDTETAPSGKVKRKIVYVGPFYEWDMDEKALIKLRTRYTIAVLISWLCFAGSILFYSDLSRLWYVILPYAFLALVLVFATCAVWNLYFAEQPMVREVRDKTLDRIRFTSIAGMLCCMITAVGLVVGIFRNGYMQAGNLLFALADPVIFFLLLYGFKVSKCLKVREKENPLADQWKDK